MENTFLNYLIENYPNSYQLGEIVKLYYSKIRNRSDEEITEIQKELINNGPIKFFQ
jgi:hypothetical protein